MKYMNNVFLKCQRFFQMILGVTLVACGLALMIKSNLGQTALTSFTQCISEVTNIKSGTLVMFFYLTCIALQILIQGKDFERIQFLQVVVSWIQGMIINMICYDIPFLASIVPSNYITQWLFILLGILCISFGVSITMVANLVKQPFEQLVMVLSEKYDIAFSKLRTRADFLFVFLSLCLILFFDLEFTMLREGTWASMFLLGKSFVLTMPITKKIFAVQEV